jgi:hypothetical protein
MRVSKAIQPPATDDLKFEIVNFKLSKSAEVYCAKQLKTFMVRALNPAFYATLANFPPLVSPGR